MEDSLNVQEQDQPDMMAAALDYLRRGLPIIPLCSPDPDHPGDPNDPEDRGLCREHAARDTQCYGPGKRPLERWKLYQSMMPTEIEVCNWWRKYPQANVGLVTGQMSNAFAVDADSDAALATIMAREGIEDAPLHLTGRGAHLFFAHPAEAPDVEAIARISAGKLGKGIDVRSEGGYIVLAPSVHRSGKRYRWHGDIPDFKQLPVVPRWVLDGLRAQHEVRGSDVRSADGVSSGERLDLEQFLAGIPQGERETQIFKLACSFRGRGWDYEGAKLAVLGAAALCRPPLPEAEALQKLDNAWKYPAPPPTVDGRALEEDEDGAPMPFPVDALPEAVARFVREVAAAIVTPPEYIAVPLLISVGATIGGRLEVAPKRGWVEGPNLFAACVGKPGAKKSPSMTAALLPFRRLAKRLAREHQAAVERWRVDDAAWKKDRDVDGPEPQKPPYPHRWTADATVEALVPMLEGAPGILLLMDELSAWVAGMDQYKNGKGADRDHYLSLWGRSSIKVDRRSRVDEPIVVEHPTLAVVGGIQPDRLPGLANAAGEDGFLARLLLSWPDPMPNGVWTEDEASYEATEGVCELFELLDGLCYDPGDYDEQLAYEVRFDAEAKQRWLEWFAEHGAETDAVAEVLNGAWAKMPAQLLRLTLILHAIATVRPKDDTDRVRTSGGKRVVSVVNPEVSLRTLQSAIALIDYFKAHARRVYQLLEVRRPQGRVAQDVPRKPRDLRREKVLRALREAGRLTQSQIQREVFQRNLMADEVNQLLADMEADGEIEREVETVGGRTITCWKLVQRPLAEAV
jgi:hypothetical protein